MPIPSDSLEADIVSLKEVKAHLRLDSLDEDDYLKYLILAATDHVEQCLDKSLSDFGPKYIPASIKHSILLLIADFYENRTTTTIQNQTLFQSLLAPYRAVRLS
ncbi:MAG: phage gp6-like head-tail connector protein [Alphaproteobacteria bacterium]|nr:phage gp6-like head-tail connector protein [Alphaproteobacteria bacterium]